MVELEAPQEVYIEPEVPGIRGYLGRFRQSFVEALTENEGQGITGTDLLCDLLEAVCPEMVLDGVFGEDGRFWVMDGIERETFVTGGSGPPLRERKLQVEGLVERLNRAWETSALSKLGMGGEHPPFASVPCSATDDPDEAQMVLRTLSLEGYPGARVAHPEARYSYPRWKVSG